MCFSIIVIIFKLVIINWGEFLVFFLNLSIRELNNLVVKVFFLEIQRELLILVHGDKNCIFLFVKFVFYLFLLRI